LILKGKPEVEILKLQYKAQKSVCKREVAYEEKQTEKKVQEHFKIRCELERLSTSTMYHAEDFAIKNIPDVLRSLEEKQN
jgi:deoxyribodipyrimidine photo-lyase